MLAARRPNQDGRISSSPSEGVKAVGVQSKNRAIAIEAQFRAPFEGMSAVRIDHILLELEDIPVGTEDGPVGGIEALKQTVAKANRWLRLVAGDEQRRASNVAQSDQIAEVRCGRARIFYCRISLVIEKLHAKVRIKQGLIRVRGWPGNLVAAETQE